MIHPVKTPLGAVRAVTHASLTVVRHPVRTVGDLTALGRGLVASVVTGDRRDGNVSGPGAAWPVTEPQADDGGRIKKQGDPLGRASDKPQG